MKKQFAIVVVVAMAALLVGCAEQPTTTPDPGTSEPSADGAAFLLAAEPEGAHDVITARKDAVDGDEITVVGRIGGSGNPWIEGRAAFSIVDESLKACSDIPGDECPKPWDYCCEAPKLASSTALVKVVDESGDLVTSDAKDLLGVKELSTVVVHGKAQRDESGNLTVLASGVYIKSK